MFLWNRKYIFFIFFAFLTLNFVSVVNAQNLRLIPPKINYKFCLPSHKPLDELAIKLKEMSFDISHINDKNLILLAKLFKNGSAETLPNISKTVEIIEYIINKKNIDPLLKASALKIKSQLMYDGEGYIKNTDEAKNILRVLVQNGDTTAILKLAKFLEIEGQYTKAEAMYKQSLGHHKDPIAPMALAYMYHNKDIIVPQITTDSFVILAQNMLLEKLARGQCNYFAKIGFMYLNLRGLTDNEKMAAEWLLPASKFNNAHAKQQLAKLIYKGYLNDVSDKPSIKILLRDAAQLGSAKAMYDLGVLLLEQDKSKNEGLFWLKKSGERHNTKAIAWLINFYKSQDDTYDDYIQWLEIASKHDEVESKYLVEYADVLRIKKTPNYKNIFSLYERAGRMGNDDAVYKMGEAYKYGYGVEKNPAKSLRYYRLATEKGNLDAYEAIIDAYECGIGKNVNRKKVEKWKYRGEYHGLSSIYNKMDEELQTTQYKISVIKSYIPKIKLIAEEKNSSRAMIRLGVMYQYLGNNELSKKWLNRAFSLKNSGESMYHYAKELQNGIIIPTDIQKSKEFMLRAAGKNNISALKNLGQYFEKSGKYITARKIFKKLYEFGHYKSAINIANIEYELGNHDMAISYLKEIANNNYMAMFELAKIYQDIDFKLSQDWFNRVQGNYICDTKYILKIAQSYIEGRNGAPKDFKLAKEWLARVQNFDDLSDSNKLHYLSLILNSPSFKILPEYQAALNSLRAMAINNNKQALHLLADYYLNIEHNVEQAIYWLTKGADNGHSNAMVQIGKLYLSGYMVEQSNKVAIEWFEKAAADNNFEAIQMLKVLEH